jgi:sortase A
MIRAAKIGYIVLSAVNCAFGIWMIVGPGLTVDRFGDILGALMVAFGIIKLIGYYSRDMYRLAFQHDLALGLLLIAAALGLVLYNQWDANRAGRASEEVLDVLNEVIVERTAEHRQEQDGEEKEEQIHKDQNDMVTVPIDGNDYLGVIEIPSLELSLPVMADWSYSKLTVAPCRYAGSYYTDDLVLCAHNYNRLYSLITRLRPGDAVRFTDMDGLTWSYEVADLETLQPNMVEEMNDSGYDFTFFTCTYGGQARLTLRCVRV